MKISKRRISITVCFLSMLLLILVPASLYGIITARIKEFPTFSGVSFSGETFLSTDLDKSKNTVIVFFSPDCNYCRAEIEEIKKTDSKLKNTQWLFLTIAAREETAEFAREHITECLKHVSVVHLDNPYLLTLYKISSPPAVFLYNSHKKYVTGCKDRFNLNHFLQAVVKWDKKR